MNKLILIGASGTLLAISLSWFFTGWVETVLSVASAIFTVINFIGALMERSKLKKDEESSNVQQ